MLWTLEFVVDYIKLLVMNMCVYYCFNKMLNKRDNSLKRNGLLLLINIVFVFIYVYIKSTVNSFLPFVVFGFIYSMILAKITGNKFGHSVIITIIAYAITFVCNTIAIIIQFIPYKILEVFLNFDNIYVSLILIMIIEMILNILKKCNRYVKINSIILRKVAI